MRRVWRVRWRRRLDSGHFGEVGCGHSLKVFGAWSQAKVIL